MRIGDIMNTKVISVEPGEMADTAWSLMQRRRIRHLIVIKNRKVVGVISDRDLGGKSGAELRKGRTVKELMTEKVVTATTDMTLRKAANLMRGNLIGSLPVLEGTKLVGIVTATDVLDELGRGMERPAVRGKRRDLRLPAGAHFAGGRKKRGRPQPTGRVSERSASHLGRTRTRLPYSKRRAPMPAKVSREGKETRGRTLTSQVPAYIRASGLDLDREDRAYLRRKLGEKLGPFAKSIERVSARIEDVNGPRGGKDKACRMKVVLSGLPSVVVEHRDAELQPALDGALQQTERAVRKALERRRTVTRGRSAKAAA